ncbi:MAG: hypothetical protein WA771_00545, partial [Chthoniobacterales bacterium]
MGSGIGSWVGVRRWFSRCFRAFFRSGCRGVGLSGLERILVDVDLRLGLRNVWTIWFFDLLALILHRLVCVIRF